MSFKRDENNRFVPTKHFKMTKSAKRLVAAIQSKELRDHFKGMMQQAIMQSFEVIEKKKKNPLTGKVEAEAV
jgi:hypothetical protein